MSYIYLPVYSAIQIGSAYEVGNMIFTCIHFVFLFVIIVLGVAI